MRSLRSDGWGHGANHALRFLRAYAILDTSTIKGVSRPVKWNEMPYFEDTTPEIKGLEFDLQIAENGGDPGVTHQNPYEGEDDDSASVAASGNHSHGV